MNNLQQLILKHKGHRSYKKLSEASNGKISDSALQVLATKTTTAAAFPTPTTIQGIADTLKLPINDVVLAAAKSAGLHTTPTPNVHDLEEQLHYHQNRAETYKTQLTALRTRTTNPQEL